MADKKVRITLVKSVIGASSKQKKIVEALGLRKLQHSVEQPDNPSIRGSIEKVKHLVTVEEL